MSKMENVARNIRKNIIRLSYQAGKKGTHIASSLSLVEILLVLFQDNFDYEKDKFILSKGHGGLGYYSVLHAVNQITREQLDTFEKNGGDFPGQPSKQLDTGILYSSGSLGLGLSYGIGHAWSMKVNSKAGKVVVVLGDGELNEGSVWESVMLARHLGLSNLLAIVDWNGMQSDGFSKDILNMELPQIWASFGWDVIVCNGHDVVELQKAYTQQNKGGEKPKVVLAETVKGKGVSFMEGNKEWHHGHLSDNQYDAAIKELGGLDGI